MARKPSVAIVGPGNLGSALAISLAAAGYPIASVIAHLGGESLRKAQRMAKRVGARSGVEPSDLRADLIWFCVPDSEISKTARAFAGKATWKGKVAFHSSGALASDELLPLRKKGAAVASVHPLMTFVQGTRPSLVQVPFAIEGDAAAIRMARRIVRDLGGRAYSIQKKEKAAYHAWGAFSSPLLIALLVTSEQVAAAAGVSGKEAKRRMRPILQQTLANYFAHDAAGAFSGPIIRGDVDTVGRHLQVLRRVPGARNVYSALVRAALHYLPAKNKSALKRVLESSAG